MRPPGGCFLLRKQGLPESRCRCARDDSSISRSAFPNQSNFTKRQSAGSSAGAQEAFPEAGASTIYAPELGAWEHANYVASRRGFTRCFLCNSPATIDTTTRMFRDGFRLPRQRRNRRVSFRRNRRHFNDSPVISTEGRNLFVLMELRTHKISPFGRDDKRVVEMTVRWNFGCGSAAPGTFMANGSRRVSSIPMVEWGMEDWALPRAAHFDDNKIHYFGGTG
uniref:Uncharacterized protein n=1 Tax=Candidatus Kentrum sp. LFY TaxID=2126342 RepID=A0A450V472_9GAMM|nr:MAG: hypothetical protein BECKLFY1418A_GA0070994_11018 [Candidatus Kentron sp. LFY]